MYLKGSPTNSLADISGIDLIPGNILEKEDVVRVCRDRDIVFHMIGNTTFDPRLKALQWRINVEGTRNVLDAFEKSPSIRRLCYTSTVNSLGIPNPVGSIGTFENSNPYTNHPRVHSFISPEEILNFADQIHSKEIPIEDAMKRINLCYFDSKLAGQELVNRAVHNSGLDIVSVLPGTMFGPYDYLVGNGMDLLALYRNGMPAVLPGGLPLCHIMDAVEGHILVTNNAVKGKRYIISGKNEDNRYLLEMTQIIVEALKQSFPEKTFKPPKRVISPFIAKLGAALMELNAKITKKPNPLSKASVDAGSLPSFYSFALAEKELGYHPKRTFQEAVMDMIQYYTEHNLWPTTTRYVDKIEK